MKAKGKTLKQAEYFWYNFDFTHFTHNNIKRLSHYAILSSKSKFACHFI